MSKRYKARFAETDTDLKAAQTLRSCAFRGGEGLDTDPFDATCRHILVEEIASRRLVCTLRLMPMKNGTEIEKSYSAQYYDLSGLLDYAGPIVEIGRFCIDAEGNDPDILRVAWGALTAYVDDNNVEPLIGCSSFSGAKPEIHNDAFALLKEHHPAPKHRSPKIKAPSVFRFSSTKPCNSINQKRAQLRMPSLLRTYLATGGWVSDHAVVDHHLNTLHVFTGVEIKHIPANRKRLLRALAG